VAESLAARLTAFDIASDGSLVHRRVWAQFDDFGFRPYDPTRIFPDGICLDMAGAIWMASPGGGDEVLRVVEGGEVTHRVAVERQPFAAMLGGPDRRMLFVCTSRMGEGFSPGLGRIEIMPVDTPGAGLP
jgi:sugar lactone lactonase YvrE